MPIAINTELLRMRVRVFRALLTVWLLSLSVSAQPIAKDPANVVHYPASELPNDERGNYYINLLKLVLSKAHFSLDVQPALDVSGIKRAFHTMAQREGVDVVWAPATPQLDRKFLRIRVPLDHGILGWRLFLIRHEDTEHFESINSLEQLKVHSADQVAEWIDTDILRFNGLQVVPSMRYKDLFHMLSAQRFTYLPRGIGEIQDEARDYANLGLQIEPRLALYYPMCAYFYVARENTELAGQLEAGLQIARNDGSFDRLFREFNGAWIQAAGLSKRIVFELDNPFAPRGPGSGHDECAAGGRAIRTMKHLPASSGSHSVHHG